MGMKSGLRNPSTPDINDLDGWRIRVELLKAELAVAKAMVTGLENYQKDSENNIEEDEPEPDDAVD